MSHLNKLPKESHNTDFSRIKPWYLDGLAPYLRQSILLSAFETPEVRSLYNHSLKNVAGKVRIGKRWLPIDIPDGVKPVCIPLLLDCCWRMHTHGMDRILSTLTAAVHRTKLINGSITLRRNSFPQFSNRRCRAQTRSSSSLRPTTSFGFITISGRPLVFHSPCSLSEFIDLLVRS